MNIFKNNEMKVESFSFIKGNNIERYTESDYVGVKEALSRKELEEKIEKNEKEVQKIEKREKQQKLYEGIVSKQLRDDTIYHKIGNITNIGKDKLFKHIIFEVFYNALLMDDDFLEENKLRLHNVVDKYIDDNNGYKLLENAINTTDSYLLKQMKNKIDNIVKESCKRKLKDCAQCADSDILSFDLNEEEEKKLNYAKDELNVDKISELVKDKVLTVVKDEKERQTNQAQLVQDIEDDLKEDEDVKDEKTLNEALQKIILNKSVVEDSTLFDSLLRSSSMEYIQENTSINDTNTMRMKEKREDNLMYDVDLDTDDLVHSDADDGSEDAMEDDDYFEDEMNMDLILSEAITKYTLMETLYTLQLEKYTPENMRKLVHKLLN